MHVRMAVCTTVTDNWQVENTVAQNKVASFLTGRRYVMPLTSPFSPEGNMEMWNRAQHKIQQAEGYY